MGSVTGSNAGLDEISRLKVGNPRETNAAQSAIWDEMWDESLSGLLGLGFRLVAAGLAAHATRA